MSIAEVKEGLKNKTLFRGTMIKKEQPPYNSFIKVEGTDCRVTARDAFANNRALPNSTVIFRLKDEDQRQTLLESFAPVKKAPAPAPAPVATPKKEEDDEDAWVTEESDEQSSSEEDVSSEEPEVAAPVARRGGRLHGEVVFIEQNPYEERDIIVKIERLCRHGHTFIYARPIDKRLSHLQIVNQEPEFLNSLSFTTYYVARFKQWREDCRFPLATIEAPFGTCDDIETECRALLVTNQIEHTEEFPEDCIRALDKFDRHVNQETHEYEIPAEERARRVDLTKMTIFSIDPVTARDLDDALSVQKESADVFKIGVHIADVSHFVEEGSAVDEEAQLRTTSIYLPHRVIPMLPRLLCENLCSLNPAVERLAFSIFFWMNSKGEVLERQPIIAKSIIRSCAKLSYDVVQDMIEGKITKADDLPPQYQPSGVSGDEVIATCLLLNEIAQKRRKWRLDNGSLTFNRIKKRFKLAEDSYPVDYLFEERKEANFLVEEYMLLANTLIGSFMVQHKQGISLLRRHEPPGEKKLEEFRKVLKELNIHEELADGRAMKGFLEKISSNKLIPSNVKKILEFKSVKLLELAKYFVVQDTPPESWGHFALQFDVYTHFTSPIRRYPDLLVHRVVFSILQKAAQKMMPLASGDFDPIIERCNEMKFKSRRISDGCERVFMCLYLRKNPGEYQGIVTQIAFDFVSILILNLDIEMKVSVKKNEQIKNATKKNANELLLECFSPDSRKPFKVNVKVYDYIKVLVDATKTSPIDYKIIFCPQ
eukprot:TRINITY_DN4362_c0_g1_i1.p1 TRINITY_DN4362_c0_g1~~TRINITY_DN4362_c0_g1_i1.p1  ORF type:complete len:766 (+),score=219.73 TRINITY_DN4362_c0_g1_i1:205-2502(+)